MRIGAAGFVICEITRQPVGEQVILRSKYHANPKLFVTWLLSIPYSDKSILHIGGSPVAMLSQQDQKRGNQSAFFSFSDNKLTHGCQ